MPPVFSCLVGKEAGLEDQPSLLDSEWAGLWEPRNFPVLPQKLLVYFSALVEELVLVLPGSSFLAVIPVRLESCC